MGATFIATDVETGGLDHSVHSLLTAHFTALDEDLNFIEEISLAIKWDNYVCTAEAMSFNKINLVEHHKTAITIEEAQKILDAFLLRNYDGKNRMMIMGHNPGFDKDFLLANFKKDAWSKAVSYHTVDTVGWAVLLKLKKHLRKHQSLKLSELVKALGVQIPFDGFHTARGDVDAVRFIVKKILEIVHVKDEKEEEKKPTV